MIREYDASANIAPKSGLDRNIVFEMMGTPVKLMDSMFEITNVDISVFNTYVYGEQKDGIQVLLFQCKKGLEGELIEKINELKIDVSF